MSRHETFSTPKLKALPRMQFQQSCPIGNLRLSTTDVSMSLYYANYYLGHHDELIEALTRAVNFSNKMETDNIIARAKFFSKVFHVHPLRQDISGKWRMSTEYTESVVIRGWDILNRETIGERQYIAMDTHEKLLKSANSKANYRLQKVTSEQKRLEKQRDEIEKRIAYLEELEAWHEAREAKRQEAKASRKPRQTAGYVYLLNEVNGPHWKIGHTSNLDNRAKAFEVAIPYQVEYEHTIETDDMRGLERELHARYDYCRIQGTEWFALSPEDIAEIKSL